MIYGIQTITTATLVTQASHISFHASIARESDAGLLEMNASGTSRPLCKWWNDTSCLRSMPVDSFTMSGGKGIGVGRSHGTLEGGAPMWLQFTELPADLGAVALLGAHLATAAADDHSFMLKVNEDPMVPMHLGEGFQTWELNPFGSSVHYFPWTRQEQLVRLKVSDLSCHVPCDTRLLFNWGSLPTSEWAHVKRAMACVHTHGSTSRLHQGGCWEQGASEGGILQSAMSEVRGFSLRVPHMVQACCSLLSSIHAQSPLPSLWRPNGRTQVQPLMDGVPLKECQSSAERVPVSRTRAASKGSLSGTFQVSCKVIWHMGCGETLERLRFFYLEPLPFWAG